jgi:CO/xanthine dehydrogenase Mo-binding subunit
MNRRDFLKSGGSLVVAFSLPSVALGQVVASDFPLNAVDSWIAIDANGKVTLLCGKVELGTGIRTAFAQIVAEELDVKLANVTVVHADTGRTPDQGVTSASRSIHLGGPQIRNAAAEARQALLEIASKRLNAPLSQLTVTDGVVSSGTAKVTYGKLVGGQKFKREVTGKAPVKKPSDYKIVGTSAPRTDLPAKLTGRHTFIQDVRVPKMVHGRVIHPAAIGASLVSVGTLPNRPKVKIVRKKDFLAVVAPTEWQAIQAAKELKVEWSGGGGLPPMADLEKTLRSSPSHDVVFRSAGDMDAGFKLASKKLSATYRWPYQNHASIGPSCAVADVRKDGTATLWSATQDVYMHREVVARLLGFDEKKVRVIYLEGSGCYGHNGADDVTGDAALLSQELGVPVRVQWMRDDEHAWSPRGAPYLIDMKGGLSERNEVVALDCEAWAMEHSSRYMYHGKLRSGYLLPTQLSGGEIAMPIVSEPGRIINTAAIAGVRTYHYRLPNFRTMVHGLQSTTKPQPLRPTELRSVSGLAGYFARESFIDELAVAAGEDPLEFRLSRLTNQRATDVVTAVAKLANWEKRATPNRNAPVNGVVTGRGISLYGENTFVAAVAEVSVNVVTGQVRVTRVNVAHDCGLIINPDGLRNQIEGNAVQATSRCLLEEVKWDDKKVTNVDWVSYPILKFPDVPDVQIALINRPEVPPTGAGEGTTYPMAGAIGNAIFDATGARMREGPFTPERVKAAIAQKI